jgi:hypothetical protein
VRTAAAPRGHAGAIPGRSPPRRSPNPQARDLLFGSDEHLARAGRETRKAREGRLSRHSPPIRSHQTADRLEIRAEENAAPGLSKMPAQPLKPGLRAVGRFDASYRFRRAGLRCSVVWNASTGVATPSDPDIRGSRRTRSPLSSADRPDP